MPIPTAPKMKRGPELLQNVSRRRASDFEIEPDSYRFVTVDAPIGYPLTIPRIAANAPPPETPKRGFITGESFRLSIWASPK